MNMLMQHRPECPPSAQNWSQLLQCWNDVEEFKQLIKSVVDELGYIKNPGITDGSNAKPGDIGEYLYHESNFTVTVPQSTSTAVFTPHVQNSLVVPPGDWDIMAQTNIGFSLEGTHFYAASPVGMTGSLFAAMWAGTNAESFTLTTNRVRMSNTSSQLLSFTYNFYNTATTPATGPVWLYCNARRMR